MTLAAACRTCQDNSGAVAGQFDVEAAFTATKWRGKPVAKRSKKPPRGGQWECRPAVQGKISLNLITSTAYSDSTPIAQKEYFPCYLFSITSQVSFAFNSLDLCFQ